MLDNLITDSKGRFITVEFTKKDGTIRKMNCRTGVTAHLKGGESKLDPAQYIIVYDLKSKGYRSINRSTIRAVTTMGRTIKG
jgi:hypothetical protein